MSTKYVCFNWTPIEKYLGYRVISDKRQTNMESDMHICWVYLIRCTVCDFILNCDDAIYYHEVSSKVLEISNVHAPKILLGLTGVFLFGVKFAQSSPCSAFHHHGIS